MTPSTVQRIEMKKVTVLFVVLLTVASRGAQIGQRRYDPNQSAAYAPREDDGRYIHDDSGRYIPDYSGLYHDDGTGRYSHIANPYKHTFDKQESLATNINANVIKPIVFNVPKRQVQYGKYDDNRWRIIRWANDVRKDGFNWEYETENEILGEEKAKVLNKDTKDETIAATGFYRYTGPDNIIYNVEYTADEKGFIPKADHLPLALQRALEHYAKAP